MRGMYEMVSLKYAGAIAFIMSDASMHSLIILSPRSLIWFALFILIEL